MTRLGGKRYKSIYEEVQRIASRHGIATDIPIVVAVSGGVDSSVLAAVVSSLGFQRVALGHVEHGIRSEEEGALDRSTVTSLADALHFPLFVRRIEGGAIERRAQQEGASVEALARNERYGQLREIARDWFAQFGATEGFLLTAHHQRDVAESFLMHLLSGRSALESVTIPERSVIQGISVVRPFLHVPRRAVTDVAESCGIPWRDDPSNTDESYLRNFIRHTIIPTLRSRYPGVERGLPAFAQEVEALREGVASLISDASWGEALETNLGETAWRIDRALFVALPEVAQGLVLRRGAQQVSGSHRLSFGSMTDHLTTIRRGAPVYLGDVEIVPSAEAIEVRRRIVRSLESGYLLEVPLGSFIEIDVATNAVVRRNGVAAHTSMRFAPLLTPIVARGVHKGDVITLKGVERRVGDIDSSGRHHGPAAPWIVIEDPNGVAVVLWSSGEWITRDGVENRVDYPDDSTSIAVQIKD